MIPDELIEELWQIKDSIAQEHGYDIEAFVAHLRLWERMESRRVMDLCAAREAAEHCAPGKRAEPAPESRDTGEPVATAEAR